MPRKKEVTLADIAKQSGLSVYTVSKALRGLPGMAEKTRQDVFDLAHRLGYLTKEQENNLYYEGIPRVSGKARRFVLVTSSNLPGSRSVEQLYAGLNERMQELGHKVEPVFLPSQLKLEQFRQWSEREGIVYADGLFITALVPEPLELQLLQLKMPRLMINFPPVGASVDSVVWDVCDGTQQSVRHLLANGHRRMFYFGDDSKSRGHMKRWTAFVEAMQEAGIAVAAEEHMHTYGGQQSFSDDWMQLLKQRLQHIKPTAILCASEKHLAWIFYCCSELGWQIPKHISLVSLDHIDDHFGRDIAHPVMMRKEAGSRAAERMLWRLANPHLPYEHIRMRGGFSAGSTVRDVQD